METVQHISVKQCCSYYKIETSFVETLNEFGLIHLTKSESEYFIDYDQLADLEKYMHLHYELDINFEGIEAISHLLQRVTKLQTELRQLRSELGH